MINRLWLKIQCPNLRLGRRNLHSDKVHEVVCKERIHYKVNSLSMLEVWESPVYVIFLLQKSTDRKSLRNYSRFVHSMCLVMYVDEVDMHYSILCFIGIFCSHSRKIFTVENPMTEENSKSGRRVVITGFGAFGKHIRNPSEDVAKSLEAVRIPGTDEVIVDIMQVTVELSDFCLISFLQYQTWWTFIVFIWMHRTNGSITKLKKKLKPSLFLWTKVF